MFACLAETCLCCNKAFIWNLFVCTAITINLSKVRIKLATADLFSPLTYEIVLEQELLILVLHPDPFCFLLEANESPCIGLYSRVRKTLYCNCTKRCKNCGSVCTDVWLSWKDTTLEWKVKSPNPSLLTCLKCTPDACVSRLHAAQLSRALPCSSSQMLLVCAHIGWPSLLTSWCIHFSLMPCPTFIEEVVRKQFVLAWAALVLGSQRYRDFLCVVDILKRKLSGFCGGWRGQENAVRMFALGGCIYRLCALQKRS